ncbi:MAG: TetR/AcrR family transcriptional regulator [Gammaproteobacteria bacterium]
MPIKKRRVRPRALPQAERVEEILGAALGVFMEKGFAAARIEDVAARAGIGKGTVYLYFKSKDALFKALVRTVAGPPLHKIEALLDGYDGPTEALLQGAIGVIKREVLDTDRKFIVRLVLTEAHRFPEIAAFYYEEVVSRALTLLRAVAERGVARGEFTHDALIRFPHLIVAPFLLAVLWGGLFERLAPLDVEKLLQAHVELLVRGLRAQTQ